MMDHLVTLSNVATILTLVAVSSTAAAAGMVPRAGPGRALALAVKSLTHVAKTPSARFKEVTALAGLLRVASSTQYIVVTGKKGVGKSVVVDTITQRTCGVTSIPVAPGSSQRTIVMDALSEVANSRISFVDPRASVRRILWWYRWLLPPPIVVLRAGERLDGQNFAELPGAARELVGYGLRVLVDGSTNSLPPELLLTKRQLVLELEDMPLETLRCIPAYSGLFDVLRVEGLESAAWGVLGGVPADYDELVTLLKEANFAAAGKPDYRRVVVNYLRDVIAWAIYRRDSLLDVCPKMREVLGEFKVRAAVRISLLTEKGIIAPSPNKVLRAVLNLNEGGVVLVPADAATALVLMHGLKVAPSIEALLALLSPRPEAPAVTAGDGEATGT